MDANRHDRYWRLDPYEDDSITQLRRLLAAKGLLSTGKINKARAIARLHRLQRKQICYDLCNDEELKKFATDRGMKAKPGQATTRRRMLNFLERADDDLIFPFLDLAPELRNLVYEYYLHDMPEYVNAPSQPPLARTCRLMRKEVLPLFYHECSFRFWIDKDRLYGKSTLSISYMTSSFVETVSETNFAKIRKFMFTVGFTLVGDGGLTRKDELAASYLVDEGVKKLKTSSSPINRARDHGAGAGMQEFIEGLPEDERGKILKKRDVERMRKVIEQYYK